MLWDWGVLAPGSKLGDLTPKAQAGSAPPRRLPLHQLCRFREACRQHLRVPQANSGSEGSSSAGVGGKGPWPHPLWPEAAALVPTWGQG